jgi:SAM-dependent methyltransferase
MNATTIDEISPSGMSATYDPADNKLRLRSVARLPKELYDRVKAAGFHWAPRQQLFVAPMWTPERADLAIELCGDIGDEDTSLVERAEERAERFEEYGEHRAEDAERAHAAVQAITDVTMGAPILIGHHSERHARKAAEKIKAGMTRAVKMWETSKYWERRAAGALRLAKYKEDPGVRHRRINGLEADLRKHEKERSTAIEGIKFWSSENITRDQMLRFANYDRTLPFGTWSALDKNEITVEEATKRAVEAHTRNAEWRERWIAHLNLRLTYERAMLGETGDIAVRREGFDVKPGGQVLTSRGWAVVTRVNKSGGVVNSFSVAGRWRMKIGIEEVTDYRPPSEEDVAKVAAAMKLPPLVNYPGEGFRSMTKAEWDSRARCSDFYHVDRMVATPEAGVHRQRVTIKGGGDFANVSVYITDIPRKDPPAPGGEKPELPARTPIVWSDEKIDELRNKAEAIVAPQRAEINEKIGALREALKVGVQVVSADQLFPTPPDLAARMVRLAGVGEGDHVLEPSAGTGNIVQAIRARGGRAWSVEINERLCMLLDRGSEFHDARCADFLELVIPYAPGRPGGLFDAVVMNPPFKDGEDIKHILHARTFLKPGGRLVAICAGGPRQAEKLKPLAETWEELPAGTFDGTNGRAILLTMREPS